jgi:hypothetical protein
MSEPEDVPPPPLKTGQHILSRAVHRSQADDDSDWWQVSYTIVTFAPKNPNHCFHVGTLYWMSYHDGWRADPDSGISLSPAEYEKLRALFAQQGTP